LFIAAGSGPAVVSQTIGLQPGRYDFSFWYQISSPGLPGAFFTAGAGGQTFNVSANNATASYTQFDEHISLTGGATTIAFGNGTGIFNAFIDDVSLIFFGPFGPNMLTPLLPQGAPANVGHVAAAIDNFAINSNVTPQIFQNLNLYNLSGTQLVAALQQLDGEASTDTEKGAFDPMWGSLARVLAERALSGKAAGAVTPHLTYLLQRQYS
jgi:hypothetical protein